MNQKKQAVIKSPVPISPFEKSVHPKNLLARTGLLLVQDPHLPNVAALVAGEPVRGSWWGHPAGKKIFNLLGELADDPDILFTKLVAGKVTLVHRSLWPAVLAVAMSREPWQAKVLGADAQRLLARVEEAGELRATGPAAKLLEKRLLVVSREEHGERGAHHTVLMSWTAWNKTKRVKPLKSAAAGRTRIEEALLALGGAEKFLPWSSH